MDYFESIIASLLESDGYWVRQSFKVNVSKEEKRAIGKHSIPRPEIDLLAFSMKRNEILAFEAKSYLDSPGVDLRELQNEHAIPEGRYKLFTCSNYRDIVFSRLKLELIAAGMADKDTHIRLGLAAGNVRRKDAQTITDYFTSRDWLFWSPDDIKSKVIEQANRGYENDPSIITAKILLR